MGKITMCKKKINLSPSAVKKIKKILEFSKKKFRIYINHGGCNGFQYGFSLEKKVKKNDILLKQDGVEFIVDSLSFQYLSGSVVKYIENLERSYFYIKNPNANSSCSCGVSFGIQK